MARTIYTPKVKPTSARAKRRAECERRILELLATGPLSKHDLGAALGISRSGARRYTDSMLAARIIHICEWRKPPTVGPSRPYYALGNQPDAVFVPVRIPSRSQYLIGQDNRRRILEAIKAPRDTNEIAALVHVSPSAVLRHLGILRKEGKVHIAAWRGAGHGLAPIYAQGSEPDADRHDPTGRIRSKKDIELATARNSALIGMENNRATVRETIAKAKANPNGIFAALGV